MTTAATMRDTIHHNTLEYKERSKQAKAELQHARVVLNARIREAKVLIARAEKQLKLLDVAEQDLNENQSSRYEYKAYKAGSDITLSSFWNRAAYIKE